VAVVIIFFVFEQDGVVDTVVRANLEPDVDGVCYYEENRGDAGDGPGPVLEVSGGFAFDGVALLEGCIECCRHG
jgi:hypothetical protein